MKKAFLEQSLMDINDHLQTIIPNMADAFSETGSYEDLRVWETFKAVIEIMEKAVAK